MTAAIADRVIEAQKRESIAARSRRSLHADNCCVAMILVRKADAASSTRIREGVEGCVFAAWATSPVAAVEAVRILADICCTREAPAREKAFNALPVVRA